MIVEKHFEQLKSRREGATITPNGDGSHTIKVPGVPIPKGWNRDNVTVAFVVPVGYPLASPDCFWTEPGLLLEHGGVPQNTSQNPGLNIEPSWLWFSWHPSIWNANNSDMETYVSIIRRRFADPK